MYYSLLDDGVMTYVTLMMDDGVMTFLTQNYSEVDNGIMISLTLSWMMGD